MKNLKRIMFMLVFTFISIFISNGIINAATSFPSSITSKIERDSNGYYYLLGKEIGWRLYAKSFSGGNVSQTALCTSFNRYAPDGITCKPVAWSNNQYNDRISGAVGAVIYEARNNKSTGAMSWDNYYYAELAINRLLYYGYTDGRGYGSKYNDVTGIPINNGKFNKAKYEKYLTIANYNFHNYGSTKVTVGSPSFNSTTGKWTATVKCTDYKGKGIGCHLNEEGAKKIAKYKTHDSDWKTVNASIESSTTISATIPAEAEKIQFEVSDKQCWNTAQNYNCGAAYQSLVPNYLVPSCKITTAQSSVYTREGYHFEVHKVDQDVAEGAENRFIEGATVSVTKDGANYGGDNGQYQLVEGRIDFDSVEPGNYCITEVKAPDGYILNDQQQCVDINSNNPNETIVLENKKYDPKNLTINKVDESGNPVVGAKIKVYYRNDVPISDEETEGDVSDYITEIASFVTDGNPKVIEGLEVNKTYTVVEEELPKEGGYAGGITEMEITISEDSSKNVVTLTNTHSSIKISKQSVTSTKELPGAKLIITDAQGNEVASWTSSDKPQEITGLSDGDYTLTELTAPQGYTIAESVNFSIENGVVKGDDDNTVVMKDATIVDVPDTFSFGNIIAMISGLVLVTIGTGVLFYETKKKKA